jgi:RecA-family ATPase
MADGISREDADVVALGEMVKARKKAKTAPHFERIDTANIQPTKWIVKKLIEAGSLNEIFGESGTGKSFLAISLASCVATGGDFFGYKTKRPGAVLYIAGEGKNGLERRFRAWQEHTGIRSRARRYTGTPAGRRIC